MKILCNFVSLLLWSRAVFKNLDDCSPRATSKICLVEKRAVNLNFGDWTLKMFVSLFWQVTALEAHPFLLFSEAACVTRGGVYTSFYTRNFKKEISQCTKSLNQWPPVTAVIEVEQHVTEEQYSSVFLLSTQKCNFSASREQYDNNS